ncbi:MAG TPA: class I SAM-dependent methyltransferase [Acidimicrobiales bacterium]|nr:class I SAM-dependent methyltransferase [Acidimicrobiales bacterium]
MAGWPFWTATSDERIERAFDLARLEAGEHLLDLGCGDGRVLLRAGHGRGARVTGVELDPELAETARRQLRDHEVDGRVVDGDFGAVDLDDVDVVFAYLSPATLQRLAPRLAAELAPGARVVTTGYGVPGWEPAEVAGRCFLYRVPVEETPIDRARRGWPGGGVLVALRPEAPSLVAVKVHHPGGRVAVRVAGDDPDRPPRLHLRAGADEAEPGDEVVVDLRFDPQAAGTVVAAALDAAGIDAPFHVLAVVDDGEPGVWGLSVTGCDAVADAIARGDGATVLADARRSTRRG